MQRLVVISLTLLFLVFPTQALEEKDPLIIINQFLFAENMEVEQWEVIMKGQINEQQTNKLLAANSLFEREINDHSLTYLLNDAHKIGSITVDLTLVKSKNRAINSELIATIYSNQYNESTEQDYIFIKNLLKKQYYSPSVQKYTCIKLKSDVIIDENDYFTQITKMFKLKDVIIHEDHLKQHTDYEMLYGYSDLWDETIQVNDHSMNIHLVKRSTKQQETAFFIGTPILLNEY